MAESSRPTDSPSPAPGTPHAEPPGGGGLARTIRGLLRPVPVPDPPPWAILLLAAAAVAVVVFLVDLTPRVEEDFFFASDDPQLRASARIEETLPSGAQVLVRAAAPDPRSPEALERLRRLGRELEDLEGVGSVLSAVSGPPSPEAAFEGPFWSRLLAPESRSAGTGEATDDAPPGSSAATPATFLVLQLGPEARPEVLVPELEEVLARFRGTGRDLLDLEVSGVPWVVELVRRHLVRDLRVFTGAALVLFGLLIALVYRDLWLAAGILATCLTACAVALGLLRLGGLTLGVLTANLVTIVFVLTLSHLVYLTANWRRLSGGERCDRVAPYDLAPSGAGRRQAPPLHAETVASPTKRVGAELASAREETVRDAVAVTGEASFWCMATTLLGFLSLLLASARPLRELGTAGAVGTAVALAAAYGLYPSFLRARSPRRGPAGDRGHARSGG
ncbi:MAG: MMPL family transporter, partial [bacterium]